MEAKFLDSCIFCKIIRGDIPSFKLIETELLYSFLDINPLSYGHCLIIPKYHAEKLDDVPDEYLHNFLPVAKKLVKALGCSDYNILQNNGKVAHQIVPHLHFHVIPKPSASEQEGLVLSGVQKSLSKEELQKAHEEIMSRL
ncbi:hypothetical protein Clacol_009629 [Clathrus columnatus]|uniref:HIT domain-containing protein n=1 Tax=Clathrus columnatus TaxID=1419009 RepID=A0AAV5AQP0_9AGAM|nr:hypothetical protein Clacol_009629 [Clathrus columnatus]